MKCAKWIIFIMTAWLGFIFCFEINQTFAEENEATIEKSSMQNMAFQNNEEETYEEYGEDENTVLLSNTKETYVQGLLQWQDDLGNFHPLRRVMIRIYDKEPIGDQLLGTTYTDHHGNFSFTFNNDDSLFENGGYDIFIRIYAGDMNVRVTSGKNGGEYYYETEVKENISTGVIIDESRIFDMNDNLGRAFQISQALLTARDFAWDMMGCQPENITVRYPYDDRCYYERSQKRITITGRNRKTDKVPHSYASWDVIMHEYGHHISYQLGIIGFYECDNHSINANSIDSLNNKAYGVNLAWAEGWATVFGLVAQNYFSSHLNGIATINNGMYDAYGFDKPYDIEENGDFWGEGCEASIIAVLWDIFDKDNETDDNMSLDYKEFWDVTTASQSKTFSAFMSYFYEKYPQCISSLGLNLTKYRMATTRPVLENSSEVSLETPPSFTWLPQGGSTLLSNDNFFVVIYDERENEIFRSEILTSNEYSLSQKDWKSVLNSYGESYIVSIIAYQLNDPITGGYYSAFSNWYDKPAAVSQELYLDMLGSDRYYEHTEYLRANQYTDYYLNFEVSGIKLLQTFGSVDTYMEIFDCNGNLLKSDDDSGYWLNSLISFSFIAHTVYKVRVKLYSDSAYGETKFAIVPGTKRYNAYEEIYEGHEDWYTYGETLELNTCAVFRISLKTETTVTFTVDAEFDSILYILDPDFPSLVSSSPLDPSTYDDDSAGNLQPKITKTLRQNVSYFIIVTAIDPSYYSGDYALHLSMQ